MPYITDISNDLYIEMKSMKSKISAHLTLLETYRNYANQMIQPTTENLSDIYHKSSKVVNEIQKILIKANYVNAVCNNLSTTEVAEGSQIWANRMCINEYFNDFNRNLCCAKYYWIEIWNMMRHAQVDNSNQHKQVCEEQFYLQHEPDDLLQACNTDIILDPSDLLDMPSEDHIPVSDPFDISWESFESNLNMTNSELSKRSNQQTGLDDILIADLLKSL